MDLRRYAVTNGGKSLARMSVEEIAEEYLGFEGAGLDKSVSMSDWDDELLSRQQVWQACYDAFVCFAIGKDMKIWKKI